MEGRRLPPEEALSLTEHARHRPHELLWWASRVRASRFGNTVKLCSIAAGKLGGCGEDCRWCAQSAVAAPGVTRPSRTATADIVSAAREAAANHAASFGIVNSGRHPSSRDLEEVESAVEEIRNPVGPSPAQICASLGELTAGQARRLRRAGVTRYNHNLETSRRFFPRVVTTHAYDDRLATLTAARDAGLELCCGGLFGMGESWEDRVDLALTLRDEVRPKVVPLNFLHPIDGTPLAGVALLPPMEILTIIALFRLVLPDADIKVAGGRERNLRDLQSWIFYAGATSTLVGNYLTTTGRRASDDLRMIEDLGLRVVQRFDHEAEPSRTPALAEKGTQTTGAPPEGH